MDWMTTKEAATIWGVTMRRVQYLCEKDLLEGVTKLGDIWVIPKGMPKPIDGRIKEVKVARAEKSDLTNKGHQGK